MVKGRFPANLIISDEILNDGKLRKNTGVGFKKRNDNNWGMQFNSNFPKYNDIGTFCRYFDLDEWFEKLNKQGTVL